MLGIKKIEVRSLRTNIRERVWIYASLGKTHPEQVDRVEKKYGLDVGILPRGVLVGTVELRDCRALDWNDSEAACFEIDDVDGLYAWCLARPERASKLLKPKKHPQPVWFKPF